MTEVPHSLNVAFTASFRPASRRVVVVAFRGERSAVAVDSIAAKIEKISVPLVVMDNTETSDEERKAKEWRYNTLFAEKPSTASATFLKSWRKFCLVQILRDFYAATYDLYWISDHGASVAVPGWIMWANQPHNIGYSSSRGEV